MALSVNQKCALCFAAGATAGFIVAGIVRQTELAKISATGITIGGRPLGPAATGTLGGGLTDADQFALANVSEALPAVPPVAQGPKSGRILGPGGPRIAPPPAGPTRDPYGIRSAVPRRR